MTDQGGPDVNSAMQYSMINSLRTGNLVWDMIIAFSIPVLLQGIVQLVNTIDPSAIFQFFFPKGKDVDSRYIEYEKKTSSWGYEITNYKSRNAVLQKAIALYLSRQGLDLNQSRVELTQKQDKSSSSSSSSSAADQLAQYELVQHPLKGLWVDIEDGLRFMRTNNKIEPGDDRQNEKNKEKNFQTEVICFTLSCKKKDGGMKRIDNWIEKVKNCGVCCALFFVL